MSLQRQTLGSSSFAAAVALRSQLFRFMAWGCRATRLLQEVFQSVLGSRLGLMAWEAVGMRGIAVEVGI